MRETEIVQGTIVGIHHFAAKIEWGQRFFEIRAKDI